MAAAVLHIVGLSFCSSCVTSSASINTRFLSEKASRVPRQPAGWANVMAGALVLDRCMLAVVCASRKVWARIAFFRFTLSDHQELWNSPYLQIGPGLAQVQQDAAFPALQLSL